ncbi:MAG: chemotaxis protein CheW [Treponema sp.]|nr:chemotaxis protein CheW [Treponema sp.]
MPKSAETTATPVDAPVENTPLEKYLIFTAGESRYALPSAVISEVAALEKFFPLPLVPGYVRGIINRYSLPYALIDVCLFLSKDISDARKVIVLKEEIDKIALLIDDVTDIVDISAETLVDIETTEAAFAGPVRAFFEWKGSPVFCLDAGELVSRIKQDFEQGDA